VTTKRGEATREHLLDVAEQLFGERGVDNVSIREIQVAAGTRNTAAVHFHFGDRDGLLDALMHRHLTRIGARQQELWDKLVADGETDDDRKLVDLLVRPVAEYMELGPSERAWVKIMADLGSDPDVRLPMMVAGLAPAASIEAGRALHVRIARKVPSKIATERMFIVTRMAVNVCADRGRAVDEPNSKSSRLPSEVFIENLVDMIQGALLAPARTTLKELEPARQKKS
jgi:AcrR family transcriptional regulator